MHNDNSVTQASVHLPVEELVGPVPQLGFLAVDHGVREPGDVARRLPHLWKPADVREEHVRQATRVSQERCVHRKYISPSLSALLLSGCLSVCLSLTLPLSLPCLSVSLCLCSSFSPSPSVGVFVSLSLCIFSVYFLSLSFLVTSSMAVASSPDLRVVACGNVVLPFIVNVQKLHMNRSRRNLCRLECNVCTCVVCLVVL